MTKRTITVCSYDLKDSLNIRTLTAALETIREWIQKYGADAKLDIGEEYSYGEAFAYIKVEQSREETDEEYSQRTAKENAQKLAQEERDRAEFQRLQAKFGEKK